MNFKKLFEFISKKFPSKEDQIELKIAQELKDYYVWTEGMCDRCGQSIPRFYAVVKHDEDHTPNGIKAKYTDMGEIKDCNEVIERYLREKYQKEL